MKNGSQYCVRFLPLSLARNILASPAFFDAKNSENLVTSLTPDIFNLLVKT